LSPDRLTSTTTTTFLPSTSLDDAMLPRPVLTTLNLRVKPAVSELPVKIKISESDVRILETSPTYSTPQTIRIVTPQAIHQVSISPTFYEQPLHQNPFAKKLHTQIVST
jgi:hypothetical protein